MARKKKRNQLSYTDVIELSEDDKKTIYKREAAKANARLLALERAGIENYVYKQAQSYNENELDRNSNRFYSGTRFQDEDDLDYALQQVLIFNKAKTSFVKGHKEDVERRKELLQRDSLQFTDETLQKFTDFLYSQQFKTLKQLADSNQVLEDFNKAIDEGFTVKQIMKQYQQFLTSDMTFEQVAERRATKKRRLR